MSTAPRLDRAEAPNGRSAPVSARLVTLVHEADDGSRRQEPASEAAV
ncbi:hypothetical protein OHA02_48950 [Streptomyces phaeochromogenes]|nr:hypothetical protein [Streptomyces phaeochromogenes]